MAQAGGKNPEKINEAVENAYEIIEKLVKQYTFAGKQVIIIIR